MERRTDAHRRHDERRASAVPESGQRRVQNLRRYAYNSLLSSFFLSRTDRKFIQSLTFNVILLIITIITHISQALVTGKRSYIESRLSCCCCCCVCCHCFSSGVKIKRERERERRHVNCRILIYSSESIRFVVCLSSAKPQEVLFVMLMLPLFTSYRHQACYKSI